MGEVNQELFISRMGENIGYKTAIIPLIPRGEVNILDYGGGTGILSQAIRMSNPWAYITIADISESMLEIARERNSADEYVLMPNRLPYKTYDVIILCSILHEVEDREKLIKELSPSLKPGGLLIIRDGYAELPVNNKWDSLKLVDFEDAYTFFTEDCYGGTIFRLDLDFNESESMIFGRLNDLRAFVDTYTWGRESVEREKHENRLWMNKESLIKLFTYSNPSKYGSEYNLNSLTCIPICQPGYFTYLEKIIKVDKMWNTHAIATIRKN